MRAHSHLVVVQSEMHYAAPELKQLFPWVAVAPVLLDRILNRLFGKAILQLESGDGKAVDKQAQVQRSACFIQAVSQLTGNAEPVGSEQQRCLVVTR
jgi:hypothetical protein